MVEQGVDEVGEDRAAMGIGVNERPVRLTGASVGAALTPRDCQRPRSKRKTAWQLWFIKLCYLMPSLSIL
jgi:hypothetical protein